MAVAVLWNQQMLKSLCINAIPMQFAKNQLCSDTVVGMPCPPRLLKEQSAPLPRIQYHCSVGAPSTEASSNRYHTESHAGFSIMKAILVLLGLAGITLGSVFERRGTHLSGGVKNVRFLARAHNTKTQLIYM